jgi:oxaloacetate decarboxylase alpha subunit
MKMKKEKKSKKGSNTKTKEDQLHKIPLRITDTTLRDAHQSLWATRMRTKDILEIIDVIDNVGYYSLEMWGGATFDVCLRFLRENPWERLRVIKAKAKNTPLQMLLRGQNLVGYRNYSDDVVDRFVALACENGIDIFRIFDALNDTRNLASAIKAVKRHGGHAQGTLAYTISPVHTVEKYVRYAKEQVAIGIDSLCIKDMAGILSPIRAERLVSALVEQVGIPIQLHCHATSGMSTATYVEGVRAGAGAIDCAISAMAGFSSQPPVETLAAIFDETNYSANLDMDALMKVSRYFAGIAPKRRLKSAPDAIMDPGILIHQIPGGMISNFRSQLDMQGALDKLPDAQEEVAKVRKDLGYPPLVTPTSQIVGTQAVMNVLSGERYKIIPNEVKDYVKGMYGRSPAPIAPKFIKMILGKEKPIKYRPADKIKPMLPRATDGLDPDLVENEEDIISYCILPEPALEYFKWRKLPPDQRSSIPADLELQAQKEEKVGKKEEKPEEADAEKTPGQMMHLEDYRGFGHLLKQAANLKIDQISISKGDFTMSINSNGKAGKISDPVKVHVTEDSSAKDADDEEKLDGEPLQKEKKETGTKKVLKTKTENTKEKTAFPHTINAPLVGTFYSSAGPGKPPLVQIGDSVKKGDKVCMVEAMKLFNEIQALEDCRILEFLVNDGESVKKDQPLVAYEPA